MYSLFSMSSHYGFNTGMAGPPNDRRRATSKSVDGSSNVLDAKEEELSSMQ